MDLIVGAGITGLSYAAATSNDYLVIEKEPEIGGYCRTILQDGFIWDYSGHFFHFRNKDIERFVMDKMHKDRDITKFGASPPSLTAENPVVFSEHHHPKTLKTL